MSRHHTLNLVLLAVVITLAWLALSPDPEPPAPTLPVTSLARGAIDGIHIKAAGRSEVALVRNGDVWWLRTPVDAPADGFRVSALLSLAEARSDAGFRAAGNDLTQYGLEPPHATVRFNQETLLIGGTDPVANKRYVLVPAQGQVHLLDDSWFSQIFGEPAAWVDPRPLMGAQQITAILLPAAAWRLTQGRWQRAPPDPTLSADTGPALADAWRCARALAVSEYDDGLEWRDTIAVHTVDGPEPVRFRFARGEDVIWLARPELGVPYRFLARPTSGFPTA